MPLVSILMTSYNSALFIQETIDSILKQTFNDFELIIVDDASTDHTVELIKNYTDSRIKLLVLSENVGVGAALNYGLPYCSGKYIAKADSDDLYHPERLQKQVEFLNNHPDITLVKTLVEFFPHDETIAVSDFYKRRKAEIEPRRNKIITPEEHHKQLYWWCCIVHSSMMIKSNVLKQYGYPNWRIGEDYNLFYQLNEAGYKIGTVNALLTKVRIRASSLTMTDAKENFRQQQLERYVQIKKNLIEKFIFEDQRDLYIWGTGTAAKEIQEMLFAKYSITIQGLIDNNEKLHHTFIRDTLVYSPEILIRKNRACSKIIIAATPVREEIVEQLSSLGFKNIDDYLIIK